MHAINEVWEGLKRQSHYFPDNVSASASQWFAVNHIGADIVIGVASLSIALAGVFLICRIRSQPGLRWFYLLVATTFGAEGVRLLGEVTLAGHLSHTLIAVSLDLDSVTRVTLAVLVWVGLPQVLQLKLPAELQREHDLRVQAERVLVAANESLEEDVKARTEAMERSMEVLVQEVQKRRESEERFKQLSETLDARVKLRTEDLQLLNQELDEFASAVSHDLRGPLRSINSFAWLLADEYGTQLQEEAASYLDEIHRGTKRMDELITTLLNYSRSSRANITREHVDVTAIARNKVEEFQLLDKNRSAVVFIEEGITVDADTRLVEVVMDNVLANAWKYTSKNPITKIRVTAKVTQQATWVHVADNGVGFDMAKAGDIFQPFKRAHTAEEFPGTGVGLSTVRRILRRHGGRIEYTSTPHMGTTFWFNFGDYT